VGMGGAYVSMARDASSIYWNPGAISRIEKSAVYFSHTSWFVDTDYNWGAVVINLGRGNAIGISMAMLDYGEQEVTTVQEQDGNKQMWSAHDVFATFSYARNLTDRFSIGGSLKYIQEKIYNESATGYAVDIGLLYITDFNDMRLGMSISNFGTDMQMDGKDLLHIYDADPDAHGSNNTLTSKYKTEQFPLPIYYRVGVSMDVYSVGETSFLLASDAVIPTDNSTIINVGGEFNWNDLFFLRAGYQSLFRNNAEEGLTYGMGVKYFVPGMGKVSFNYAMNDYGLLQEVHTMSIGIIF
ncbi:MAG: PorV/PorQ family protein, partial [Calditrichia bacterium]|nr:PorV/PorQ family protein [Calditrichia bacterium]